MPLVVTCDSAELSASYTSLSKVTRANNRLNVGVAQHPSLALWDKITIHMSSHAPSHLHYV